MPNSNRGSTGFQSAEFEQEYEKPSKSQRKRDMTALQKLGQQLVDAPADRVKRIDLPENLKTAIEECRKIKSHEGRRRQLQFIGKIMRGLDDADVALINKAVESWRGQSKAETAAMHALERQRDRLLAEDSALTALLSEHPQTDAQHLRNLIRNARKEQAEGKPPKAYREIFQILKQLHTEPSAQPEPTEEDEDE
ncbi:DUF615 domain-containing protein [Oxalobacter sp. OttesenSCG-928-P03]|nr:DUF615 domain-containing protein [Oxalobacter sp. OttesenSCG-928-P03]